MAVDATDLHEPAAAPPGLPTIENYVLPPPFPASSTTWALDPARVALLVHDMQEYFLRALPDAMRDRLVGNTVAVREWCDSVHAPVAFTAQPGRMTPTQRGLLADFWGPGMRTTPADRRIVPELAPGEADWSITKWRYSAFHHTDLLARLRAAGRDQLLICGVYAHVGILATAIDAFSHDVQPFVVADATADFTAAEHADALRYVARRCGVVLVSAEVPR
ncbi:isochorismatase family protein [Nocardia altamirensis]|uniref:isochorismatase family protein n=1 Tax=Nocardia altamirensis TaxID=472158 RepID=UPI00083FF561|nr:isochorismatase family protein [Nocardia altamirensis]